MLTRCDVLKIYGIPDGVVKNREGVGEIRLDEYAYGYGKEILR